MPVKIRLRLMASVMIISILVTSFVPVYAGKKIPVRKIKVTAPAKRTLKMKVGEKFKLKTRVLPVKATQKKLRYTSSKKKVASVTKKGVIKAKKTGKAKITIRATDKSKKKAVIKIKVVKKKSNITDTKGEVIIPTVTTSPPQTQDVIPDGDFTIVSPYMVSQIYLNEYAEEYDGLRLVAECFSEDLNMVSDATPDIITDESELGGNVIIFGSIGNNPIIDNLISTERINVDSVRGKWEVYQYDVVENPVSGVDKALVITGSDKRGAIYGLFNLSEMMGVSPFVYWADVTPAHKDTVTFKYSELRRTSKEPSVKYRGLFLNDEEPALGTWVQKHFKKDTGSKFNEYFYEKVFQLLLRLKANYLWPAMWNSAFGAGGVEFPEKSAELADEYGIIMGTSHHEPMMLAHQEWNNYKSQYGNEWNWATNKEGLTEFFRYGAEHYGQYENICTIGMRGDGDATMLPEGSTVEENVTLLKDIITTQKSILEEYGLSDKPTMIALYKEVEEYWYGDSETQGLKDWDGLDDTIVMLAEDNYGNLRTLPGDDVRDRAGGFGMYYHFDYNGAPASYMWTQTFQLQKVWEQMTMAYDYGVDDIWIVNVGDLKPMEMPLAYFLDMAYDFDKWGTGNINSFSEYEDAWISSQFGESLSAEEVSEITDIINDYLKITTYRKPEIVTSQTYSVENYNEVYRILADIDSIKQRADKYMTSLPDELLAAYYQLVYYPAVATTNVIKIQLYSALNQAYAKLGLTGANYYASLMNEAIDFDKEMENTYNKEMPGGLGDKWDGMMDQAKNTAHIGYDSWEPKGAYPTAVSVSGNTEAEMNVLVQGSLKSYTSGQADMDEFTDINNETYYVRLMNTGNASYEYSISSDSDWIITDKSGGEVYEEDVVNVSVDFDKISESSEGSITITGNSQIVTINISARIIDVSSFDSKTYVEAHDYVAIEAGRYSAITAGEGGAAWKEIKGYGRTESGMKVFPTTSSFYDINTSPCIEYKFYVDSTERYTLQTHIAPSNNVDWNNVTMKFGYSIDDGYIDEVDTITPSYIAGTWRDSTWSNAVRNNIRSIEQSLGTLTEGVHTLRIYAIDPALVMEKYIIYPASNPLKKSYLGPCESYIKED